MSALEQHPVFAKASRTGREKILAHAWWRSYNSGDLVLSEGDPARNVYALMSGEARVYHVSDIGDQVLLKLFQAPAIFGEAEALSGIEFVENVCAERSSEILVIPVGVFLSFLQEEGGAAVEMLIDVASRLAIASYNQKSLAFHPSTIRLANYLLDYAQWTNGPDVEDWSIELTQDQMAAAVGVTRRSVAKDVIAWQEEGILKRRGRGYVLLDRDALQRYCDPRRLQLTYKMAQSKGRS
jgi:CRP/FNR family transcriptional regulator